IEAPTGNLDRADAAAQEVVRGGLRPGGGGQVDVVQIGVLGRPQARVGNGDRAGEGVGGAGADRGRAEVDGQGAEGAGDVDRFGRAGVVANRHLARGRPRAAGAGEVWQHLDVLEVDGVHAPEID